MAVPVDHRLAGSARAIDRALCLVGVELLERWYEAEPDIDRHVLMNEWLADLLHRDGRRRSRPGPACAEPTASKTDPLAGRP